MADKTKTKEQRAQQKAERDLADIRFVAKSPEGRRLLWRIMADNGVFRSSVNSDSIMMGFAEGRRTAGLSILHDIFSAKASLFGQMQQEHASELKREAIILEKENEERDPLSLD